MITSLSMKNFKAFEDEVFELGTLNILAGLNNSGKSSVIQALRLIDEGKALAGLGPLREYVRSDSSEMSIECNQKNKDGENKLLFSFNKTSNVTCPSSGRIGDIVSYISADRYGPRNVLSLNIDSNIQTVGYYGENLIDFLSLPDDRLEGLNVPEKLAISGTGIRSNIQEWLRVISPGVEFNFERDDHMDMGRTEFNGHRATHVGFGLSYTLPIIVSILIHVGQLFAGDVNTAFLLLENPEAHLHPSGQSMMGRMLALAASCGLQIVVETHSDHLLNGVRIAVKEGKLSCTDVKCYFFKADTVHAPIKMEISRVERLTIDRHGMLDHWPDGFFDETEKNLMQLV